MYEGMIETSYLQILLKSFHENYSDRLKKQHSNKYQSHVRDLIKVSLQLLFVQVFRLLLASWFHDCNVVAGIWLSFGFCFADFANPDDFGRTSGEKRSEGAMSVVMLMAELAARLAVTRGTAERQPLRRGRQSRRAWIRRWKGRPQDLKIR